MPHLTVCCKRLFWRTNSKPCKSQKIVEVNFSGNNAKTKLKHCIYVYNTDCCQWITITNFRVVYLKPGVLKCALIRATYLGWLCNLVVSWVGQFFHVGVSIIIKVVCKQVDVYLTTLACALRSLSHDCDSLCARGAFLADGDNGYN